MLRLIFLFYLLFFSIAHADQFDKTHTIPEGSSFSFYKRHHMFESVMFYSGEAQISVYFEIQYKNFAELEVFPDTESIKKLPYQTFRPGEGIPERITIRDKKWIQMIDAVETDKSIPSLEEVMSKFALHGKVQHKADSSKIIGNATIIIDNYKAGYECDNPFFLARIKKIVKIENEIKFVVKIKNRGCK